MVSEVAHISPYLIEGGDTVILSRTNPISPTAPDLAFGNMPNDDGHLLLNREERNVLLQAEPEAGAFIRPFLGPTEFLNGGERWCLWLVDAAPDSLRRCPH